VQVTWVEHAEVEEKPVHHIFSEYVYSGMAFGAQRWLAVLQRQCERVASLMARNISDLGGSFLFFFFFFFHISLSLSLSLSPEASYSLLDLRVCHVHACSDTLSRSTEEHDEVGSKNDKNFLH
jgi:hypothetical protein